MTELDKICFKYF